MGIKVGLWASGARRPRLAMAEHVPGPHDAERARSAAESLFPGRIGEPREPVPMRPGYFPTDGVVRVAVFDDVVVASAPTGEWPQLPGGSTWVELHFNSVSGSFMLEYADRDERRSLVYADGDTLDEVDLLASGDPLPYERDLWPADMLDPDGEVPGTYSMIERSLAWIFGAPGEGLAELEGEYLPDERTMLYGFQLLASEGGSAISENENDTAQAPDADPEPVAPRDRTWPIFALMAAALALAALIVAIPVHSELKYWGAFAAVLCIPVALIVYPVAIFMRRMRYRRAHELWT